MYRPATPSDYDNVCDLLRSSNLPVDDIDTSLRDFIVLEDADKPIACIGLEVYGRSGLLRSLVVKQTHRNEGIAYKLIVQLESLAAKRNLEELYLVTNTAEQYFARKGFEIVDRIDLPKELLSSREFSDLCPASSAVMKKSINKLGV